MQQRLKLKKQQKKILKTRMKILSVHPANTRMLLAEPLTGWVLDSPSKMLEQNGNTIWWKMENKQQLNFFNFSESVQKSKRWKRAAMFFSRKSVVAITRSKKIQPEINNLLIKYNAFLKWMEGSRRNFKFMQLLKHLNVIFWSHMTIVFDHHSLFLEHSQMFEQVFTEFPSSHFSKKQLFNTMSCVWHWIAVPLLN